MAHSLKLTAVILAGIQRKNHTTFARRVIVIYAKSVFIQEAHILNFWHLQDSHDMFSLSTRRLHIGLKIKLLIHRV